MEAAFRALLLVAAFASVMGSGGYIKVTNHGSYTSNCSVNYRLNNQKQHETLLAEPGQTGKLAIPNGATKISAGAYLASPKGEGMLVLFGVMASKPVTLCYKTEGTADYPQSVKVDC